MIDALEIDVEGDEASAAATVSVYLLLDQQLLE